MTKTNSSISAKDLCTRLDALRQYVEHDIDWAEYLIIKKQSKAKLQRDLTTLYKNEQNEVRSDDD